MQVHTTSSIYHRLCTYVRPNLTNSVMCFAFNYYYHRANTFFFLFSLRAILVLQNITVLELTHLYNNYWVMNNCGTFHNNFKILLSIWWIYEIVYKNVNILHISVLTLLHYIYIRCITIWLSIYLTDILLYLLFFSFVVNEAWMKSNYLFYWY